MSNTIEVPTRTNPSASAPTVKRQPVWKHGVTAAVVAAVATTVLAAVASAAGVSSDHGPGGARGYGGFGYQYGSITVPAAPRASRLAVSARQAAPAISCRFMEILSARLFPGGAVAASHQVLRLSRTSSPAATRASP